VLVTRERDRGTGDADGVSRGPNEAAPTISQEGHEAHITPRLPPKLASFGERRRLIVEMLIATVIMMAVTAATFGLMIPRMACSPRSRSTDMQQRLRIAMETLQRLLMAGAGTYRATTLGSLGRAWQRFSQIERATPDPPVPTNARRHSAVRSAPATPSR
jgi:hypothetical protein